MRLSDANDERRAVLGDAVGVRNVAAGAAVEGARPESLRPGVVDEHVREDVPGQIRAALEALVRVAQVLRVDIGRGRQARRRARLVTAEAAGDRAFLEVVELVVARAGGHRQHLGNDVEVERGEEGELLVAALARR